MMSFLNNLKISLKLPAIMVLMGVLSLAVMGAVSYHTAKASLEVEARARLASVVDAKVESFTSWLMGMESDMVIVSGNPAVRRALTDFIGAWTALPGDKTAYLQQSYITDNPHPEGERLALDYAEGRDDYSRAHRRYHPFLRTMAQQKGYADMFLVDPDGNILYSVAKYSDFGANLLSGDLAQSPIGQAFSGAMERFSGEALFVDLQPYDVRGGALTGFMSIPIAAANGAVMGVLIVEVSGATINARFKIESGLGETGYAMLVGEDHRLRVHSRRDDVDSFAQEQMDSPAIDLALDGGSGVVETVNADGVEVLSVVDSIWLGDLVWAVLVEQSRAELFAPAAALRN